jgi:uncharacterized delta-60 repeat protein
MQSKERSAMWLTRAGLALALLLSACSQTGHLVVVSVQATVAIPTAATLHTVATADGRSHSYDIPLSPVGIPPVRSFGITVPPSVKGSFAITVQALDGQGKMLGEAQGQVMLPSSGRVDMMLDLTTGGQVGTDGGVAGDDMAMPSVALATTAQQFMVRQGDSVAVPLTVTRGPGVTGDVVVTVDGLPNGVAAQALTIAAGETKGALSLIASGSAGQGGPNPLSITGTLGATSGKLAIDLYVAGAPGTLDQSFNSTGIVSVDNPTKSYDVCQALALTPAGLPVIAGQTRTYIANTFGTGHSFAARATNVGLLDPGFGTNGRKIVTNPNDSSAQGVAVQPDGKVVLVGRGAITSGDYDVLFVRLGTDGTPDGTFGTAGVASVSLGSTGDVGWAAAVQTDGKIVAVASDGSAVYVVRVGTDGTPDPDFGTKGIASVPKFGTTGNDSIQAILLQADGKIVIGGTTTVASAQGTDAVVARLTDKGVLDSTFGNNGRTIVNGTYNGNDSISSLATAPDGSIVAGGTSQIPLSSVLTDRFAAYHFGKDGAADTVFGAYSYAGIVAFGDKDDGYGVAVQPSDGKIVLTGTVSHGSNKVNAFTRLDSRGNLDPTFGTQGKLEIDGNSAEFDGAYQVALDPGGRIVVTGFAGVDSNTTYDCTIFRIWP